ncbi:MAG: phage tail tape measure protein [Gordonibacter sp.]
MADGRVIIEAILDTANVSKNVKNLGKELNGVSWKNIAEGDKKAQALSGAFKDAGTACTMKLTAPVVAAGVAAFGVASNYEQATARIQSALGITGEEAERLGEVGEGIYENGFGESLDQVTDALITVKENLGDVNDADLSAITQGALVLEQTLGMDMTETVRGAGALVKSFGMDGAEAMDYITVAAQNGLDMSGELGDNLAEYATLFQENGYSASEMFSVLEAGLDAGAYNLDKVNDLVKEFGIRMADGTVAKACDELGGDFKAMFDEMTASGASNKEIFSALSGEISTLGTEQEKAAAISAIFGSQGEDNGTKVIEAMGGVSDAYADVAGAAQKAADTASDSFGSKMESAMRTLMGSLEPLGEPLLNIATKVAEVVKGFGEWFAGIGEGGQTAALVIAGILAAIGPVLSILGNLVNIIPAITGALGGAGAGAGLFGGAMTALSGPIGIVVGIIATLIAAFVYLWNTNEGFRNSVMEAWNAIMTTVQTIIEQLRPYIEQAWIAIQNAVTTVMGVIVPLVVGAFQFIFDVVVPIVQSLMQTIGALFTNVLITITGIMNGISSIVGGVWNVICGIVQTVCGLIHGIVTGDFSQMQAGISQIMDGILGIITGIWDTISSVIGGVINTIGTIISGGLDAAKASVEGIFNGIKGIIDNVMGGAQNIVSDALNNIAGFFSGLNIQWPHIPLPHFEMSGSFNLDPFNFSLPSIGISWYAKGGVFNGASIIGVGEAGNEAVVPLTGKRMQPFADAIAGQMGGRGNSGVTVEVKIENFNNYTSEDLDALVDRVMRDTQRKLDQQRRARGYA